MSADTLAAGLKLLSAKDRRMHPRGQVQKLRRIAVRAINDADWREELIGRGTLDDSDVERAGIAGKRARAAAALAAMQHLNREHNLGY